MIIGSVGNEIEPIVPLTVFSSTGVPYTLEALVDTGYNGDLCLSPALIQELQLPFISDTEVTLADGSMAYSRHFSGHVEWFGIVRRVVVLEAEEMPAIGMSLIYGSTLTVKAIEGGLVVISGLV